MCPCAVPATCSYPAPWGNVSNSLVDYQIQPDPGYASPYQTPGALAGDPFTVVIT